MIGRVAAVALPALALSFAVLAGCENIVSSAPLKIGDCFNTAETVDANGDSVLAYEVVECTTAHDGEAFSEFDYPNAGADRAFPGYEQIGTIMQNQCQTDFKAYVGVDWDQSKYTISYNSPTDSTWKAGDRRIQCLVEDASAGKLTGSAKGTKK